MDKLWKTQSAWKGHREFAQWLIGKIQPKITVELGVDYGYSLFTLAENNPGLVVGIDLFEGDAHTGQRGQEQADAVAKFAAENGYQNVRLIKNSFDAVAEQWNADIDLLHIDGLHTYDAVLNDFKRWSPFVSQHGVVLMHDITSFSAVMQVFVSIAAPKVAFLHSGGLGVICRDQALADTIRTEFSNAVSGQELVQELERRGVMKPIYPTV